MARLASLVAVATIVAALAGCGGSSGSGGAGDPATAVPVGATFYLEATVRPSGGQRGDALDAAGKLLRAQDPAGRIRRLVSRAFARSHFDYARDVEPWLGPKAALWSDPGGPGARGAAILSTTDVGEARDAIARAVKASSEGFAKRTYHHTDYELNRAGEAVAIVGSFAVFGTEPELERTIDAQAGRSLASDARFKKALAGLPGGRLGTFYVDPRTVFDAAARRDPAAAAQLRRLESAYGLANAGPIAGALSVTGDKLTVDTIGSSALARSFGGVAGSTPLVAQLPGDAWVAVGMPKLGQSAKAAVGRVAGALGGAALSSELRSQLGLDLERDVFSWMGDAALFVRGNTASTVDGGLVIQATDQDRAASGFGKIVGVLNARRIGATPVRIDGAEAAFAIRRPGAARPIVLARDADRVVVAYGQQAAAEALSPREKLGDGPAYERAKSLLGDGLEPNVIVNVPSAVTLASSAPHRGARHFAQARRALGAVGIVASGGTVDGDTARSRAVAELR